MVGCCGQSENVASMLRLLMFELQLPRAQVHFEQVAGTRRVVLAPFVPLCGCLRLLVHLSCCFPSNG